MKWLDSITDGHEFEQTPGSREGQGNLAVHGVGYNLVTEQQPINKNYKGW